MKKQESLGQVFNELAYVYPSDIQKCVTHRLANRIFRKIDFTKEKQDICQCCGRYVGQQSDAEIFCYDPLTQFSYLGPGVPLLFAFAQKIIITLVLLVGIVAVQGLISNNSTGECEEGNCSYQSIFSKLSVSQKILESGTIKVELVLTLVFTLLWIVLNQFFLYRCRSYETIADEKICTPSDFAVFLLNLPEGTTKEDIEAMLNHTRKIIQTKLGFQNLSAPKRQFLEEVRNFKVEDIIIPLKLDEYIQKQRKEEERFKQSIKNGTFQTFQRSFFQRPKELTNFAIVVFEKEITKKLFLKHYDFLEQVKYLICNWGLNESSFRVKNKNISVVRASQPDDILWQNLENSHRTIIINKCYTFGVGFLVVFIGALIQFALSVWEINNLTSSIHTFIVGLSSVLVTFVNYIISVFLVWATDKQGNITKSKYNASLNVKICIFQFINSGIFYTISNLLASLITQIGFYQNLEVVFAEKVTFFMIINAFSEPIQNIILNYFQIPNSLYRFFLKYKLIKPTQKQSNSLYELNDSKIPFKYAYVVKTIWLTCFYTPFVPIVSVISLAGLVFYYVIMKLSFRYCYKITEVRSNQTNLRGLRLSYFAPFMLNLGQLMTIIFLINNFYELQSSQNTIMYVSLIFSIVYGLFPWYQMNQRLFHMKNDSKLNYKQVKKQFQVTYDNKMFEKIHRESIEKNQNYFFLNQIRKFSSKENLEFNPILKNVLESSRIRSLEVLPSTRNLIPST